MAKIKKKKRTTSYQGQEYCSSTGKFLGIFEAWKKCASFSHIHGGAHYEFNEWTYHECERMKHQSLCFKST